MTETTPLFEPIKNFISSLDCSTISSERKEILQPFIKFLKKKKQELSIVNIQFICTHNSRRSHLAQIWTQTIADYFHFPNIHCYSGGTEETALFPQIVETLKMNGFQITPISQGKNPIYNIKYGANTTPIIGFSKTVHHCFNPSSDFVAIMTCSQADEECPIIKGATIRIPIPFEDPKLFDNTPQQQEKYLERSKQIATEMYYVFSEVCVN